MNHKILAEKQQRSFYRVYVYLLVNTGDKLEKQ